MEKLNTASVSNINNETELRVTTLNNEHNDINETKCEMKLEEEEIYTFERGPKIEETDVFVNVDHSFVKAEDTWKMEEVDDKEEHLIENNFTENSDNETDTVISVNSNTHATDTNSDSSGFTSTQVHTTNKKQLYTPVKKSHKCLTCSKSFSTKAKLQIHTRVHTGEKPNKCATCQKRFVQQAHLVRHMRTHTGEKPYKCALCEKCYTRQLYLMCHMRTHTGEKPI